MFYLQAAPVGLTLLLRRMLAHDGLRIDDVRSAMWFFLAYDLETPSRDDKGVLLRPTNKQLEGSQLPADFGSG